MTNLGRARILAVPLLFVWSCSSNGETRIGAQKGATNSTNVGPSVNPEANVDASGNSGQDPVEISAGDVLYRTEAINQQLSKIRIADARVREACMRRAGFVVRPRDTYVGTDLGEPNMQQRAEVGWFLWAQPDREISNVDLEETDPDIAANYGSIAFGDGKPVELFPEGGMKLTGTVGGCTGEAIDRVFGSLDHYKSYLDAVHMPNLVTEYIVAERFEKFDRTYSRCMEKRGYKYTQIGQAERDWRDKLQSYTGDIDDFKTSEIAAALADGSCIKESGFLVERRSATSRCMSAADPERLERWERAADSLKEIEPRAAQALIKANQELGLE